MRNNSIEKKKESQNNRRRKIGKLDYRVFETMRKGKEKKRKKRGLSKARSVLYLALKKKKKKPGLQLSYLERPICQPPSQESRTRTSPANQRIDPGDRNGRSSLLLLPLPSSKQTPKDRPLGHRPSLSHHHNNNHHHNHILSSSSQRSRLPWTVLDRDPFIVVSPTNRRTERDGTGRDGWRIDRD